MLPQMTQRRGERERERKRRQMSLWPSVSPAVNWLCVGLFDAGRKRQQSYLHDRTGRTRTQQHHPGEIQRCIGVRSEGMSGAAGSSPGPLMNTAPAGLASGHTPHRYLQNLTWIIGRASTKGLRSPNDSQLKGSKIYYSTEIHQKTADHCLLLSYTTFPLSDSSSYISKRQQTEGSFPNCCRARCITSLFLKHNAVTLLKCLFLGFLGFFLLSWFSTVLK